MANHGGEHRRIKRRRTSPGNSIGIVDLPNEALATISIFLPQTSVALLAVAVTAPPLSWLNNSTGQRRPSAKSKAILSPSSTSSHSHAILGEGKAKGSHDRSIRWDVLDFEDIDESNANHQQLTDDDSRSSESSDSFEEEETLANKLSDDDVGAILVCIDAVNKLKRLKLAGCINITGRCLKPLCRSVVLEQLDLSLVKRRQCPYYHSASETRITETVVLPILRSIVTSPGNSLSHIQFPKRWPTSNTNSNCIWDFEHFLTSYNQHLDNQSFICSGCVRQEDCPGTDGRLWFNKQGYSSTTYSSQKFTCYHCLKNCCASFNCYECSKRYCQNCVQPSECRECGQSFCQGCRADVCEECNECNGLFCENCMEACNICNERRCQNGCSLVYNCNALHCSKSNCRNCVDDSNVNTCDVCDYDFCFDCRMKNYRRAHATGQPFCTGCTRLVGPEMRATSDGLVITDLSNSLLAHAMEYLPNLSVALFAAALTAPSSSWSKFNLKRKPSAISNAILSALQWGVLDFEDIGKQLASKLTDDDIGSVLTCLNAVTKVKNLKVTGCTNISGRGLEPLRGSMVLEQIDLSLVKQHTNPNIRSAISEEAVLLILHSIICKQGNRLRQVQMPSKWALGVSMLLSQFAENYTRLLQSRPFNCAGCIQPEGCNGTDGAVWVPHVPGDWFGVQLFTCYLCMRNFCGECDDDVGSFLCYLCDKNYCGKCVETLDCGKCEETFCKGCMPLRECELCVDVFCDECWGNCDSCDRMVQQPRCGGCSREPPLYQCENDSCKKLNCATCVAFGNVLACNDCGTKHCFDCRLVKYRAARDRDEQFCSGCTHIVVAELLKESGRM